MNDRKERKIFRLLPCYRNDILALEAWLEDMAAEGYMLKKIFLSVAIFVEAEPANVRYRFLPKPVNKLIDMGGEPTEQDHFIALREQEGWRYVTGMTPYFIFRTKNTALPEPERDLYEVASNRYHEAKKSLVMILATTICSMATLGIVDALSLRNMVWYGTLIILFTFWMFFYAIGVSTCEVLRWKRLKRVMESTEVNRCDWQECAGMKKINTVMVYIITTTLLIGSVGTYLYNVHPSNTMAMQQYEEHISIPTIAEWNSDTTFVFYGESSSFAEFNVIEKRSDLLAPVIIEFNQNGLLYRDDVLIFDGDLNVEYYETILPELAKPLAKSLYEDDRAFGEKYTKYRPLEIPEVSVDYAIAYQTLFQNTVVLAEGNKVIRVYYYQEDGTDEMTVDKLAQIYADYLLSENSAAK